MHALRIGWRSMFCKCEQPVLLQCCCPYEAAALCSSACEVLGIVAVRCSANVHQLPALSTFAGFVASITSFVVR
jgi:hypothetical protein